jgi:hypothetical protein
MAPPTDYQEPFLQPQSSNWPKIIGIIAIVFGAVASLFGVLGLLAQLMVDKLAEVVPDEQKEAMTASMQNQGMNILSTALQLGAAVLLIVGGVKLLGRKRSGVSICRAWAVLKILVVILASVISYSAVKAQMEMIQNDPELANAQCPRASLTQPPVSAWRAVRCGDSLCRCSCSSGSAGARSSTKWLSGRNNADPSCWRGVAFDRGPS